AVIATLFFGTRIIWAAAAGYTERLARPDYLLGLVGIALPLGLWLTCRKGNRSFRFVSVAEAIALIGLSDVVLHIGRMGNEMAVDALTHKMDTDTFSPEAWASISTIVHFFTGTALTLVLAFMFVLRAAFVPSTARHTAILTAIVAFPLVTITGLGVVAWEDPNAVPMNLQHSHQVGMAAWTAMVWAIITLVCTAISRVVYALRQEVRAARQMGQYTLEAKLGEGGMGVVYRARHALMRRPTAVKLVLPEKAGDATLERFEREVQLTAQLTHPNTITIFDYGRTPDGVLYYAMELLDGATLEAVIEHDGAQPAARVMRVLSVVADALAEAHESGLIHRDIKPANILLCKQGGHVDVAKVLDFGLVKAVAEDEDASLTREGTITGTPQYLSPEAIASATSVDARSDLYALGAVGYYMLTGTPVFESGTVVEVCAHHLHTPPTPPSERLGKAILPELEQVVLDCLAKKPEDRPQTAHELTQRLEAIDLTGQERWTEARARAWWNRHGEALEHAPVDEQSAKILKTVEVAPRRWWCSTAPPAMPARDRA
ncbi:MAG: serine/threonine protein kinase, partial [Deltaproteobacteria bacterium]|nr:serine/threonine protein kinase [Deltaproteobacteria bacterium]MBW2532699.1 serine/threonine protein kinase [Deltaproteobacteria bacterium]